MSSDVWPEVSVGGSLEAAEREWLHTNGAGAYSMSTVAMMHTRRYHGLLVAALEPPHRLTSIVSHAETTVTVRGKTYRLATHRFPDIAPTPGYRLLERFAQDPLPRWTYRLGRGRLERVLCLVPGVNAVVLAYTWRGKGTARLSVKPLLSLRDAGGVTHEHGGMIQRVRLRPGVVESRPVDTLPAVVIAHSGVFLGSPDWYRRFEYAHDKVCGFEGEEDLWTPGTIEVALTPGASQHIVLGVESLPDREPALLIEEARDRLLALDPGPERPQLVRRLLAFGATFRLDAGPRPTVAAGYPWLGTPSLDAIASVPGLYLVRGDVEGASAVLRTAMSALQGGLLPEFLGRTNTQADARCPEASLRLFECARLLADRGQVATPFLERELYPALKSVAARVRDPRREMVWLTREGLIASLPRQPVPTFRDTRTGTVSGPVRRQLRVELQALWTHALETLVLLADEYGDVPERERSGVELERARSAFNGRFWSEAEQYAFDSLPEEPESEAGECKITPNALLALELDPLLFKPWQGMAILARVRQSLLVARGVRARAPRLERARRAGPGPTESSAAYHHTVAWTGALGIFARAALRLNWDDFDLQENLLQRIRVALEGGPVLGQIAEFYEADEPFRPLGCPAVARSTADLLRTVVWDLRL